MLPTAIESAIVPHPLKRAGEANQCKAAQNLIYLQSYQGPPCEFPLQTTLKKAARLPLLGGLRYLLLAKRKPRADGSGKDISGRSRRSIASLGMNVMGQSVPSELIDTDVFHSMGIYMMAGQQAVVLVGTEQTLR